MKRLPCVRNHGGVKIEVISIFDLTHPPKKWILYEVKSHEA